MKNKVRIGKDFTLRWALLTSEGEPYAINADAAILRIYSPYGVKEAIGFIVSGNVIEWVFKGKDQKHLGDYTIELVENNGQDGMVSVDFVEAFTLVAHTNEESLNDEGAVEIQTIELTSQIALAPVVVEGEGGAYDDTEIRNEITRLDEEKASKEELTELSAEVSGLSDRVDELGEGGSSVFEVVYGVTTYDEIVKAYEAKKHVICLFNNNVYSLFNLAPNNDAYFTGLNDVYSYRVICRRDNVWYSGLAQLEKSTNKTTSLSDKSTDTQYPSAKAVYEALQNVGGGGASNKWKCVFDGRMEVGTSKIECSTYADGTPLKAEEMIVQVLIDENSTTATQGYVTIHSTNNQTDSLYGALYFEKGGIDGTPQFCEVKFKASPMFMVAEMCESIKPVVAQGGSRMVRLGNKIPPQIYEDITYIKVISNSAIQGAAPLVKIYAR